MEEFCDIIRVCYADPIGLITQEKEGYCSNCHMNVGKKVVVSHFLAEDPKDDEVLFNPTKCPYCGKTFSTYRRHFLNTETGRTEYD